MVSLCKKIAESKWFQNSITIAIIIAGILVGIATYGEFAEEHHALLELLNRIVLWIFVAEVVIKMVAEGKKPLALFL